GLPRADIEPSTDEELNGRCESELQPPRHRQAEHRRQQGDAEYDCRREAPALGPYPPRIGGTHLAVALHITRQELRFVSGAPDRRDQIGRSQHARGALHRAAIAREIDLRAQDARHGGERPLDPQRTSRAGHAGNRELARLTCSLRARVPGLRGGGPRLRTGSRSRGRGRGRGLDGGHGALLDPIAQASPPLKPAASSAPSRSSAGAVPVTVARPPTRSTRASITPGTAQSARATAPAQPLQVMPETASTTGPVDSRDLSSAIGPLLPVHWNLYSGSPHWKVNPCADPRDRHALDAIWYGSCATMSVRTIRSSR